MATLFRRTVFLTASRFANQAILLLSPFVMVRLLDVTEYGRYREFMLYGSFIALLAAFSVARSLPYFVPKFPDQSKVWITQAIVLVLAFSTVCSTAVLLFGDIIRSATSFDFVAQLALYIMVFANLDFLEYYWLARKRTDLVLYYSLGRMSARMGCAIAVAYTTRDATEIINALIVLELARAILVLSYTLHKRWLGLRLISRETVRRQASYFVPLGAGGLTEAANSKAGMFLIAAIAGPEALALYVIGTFAIPLVNVLRGSIADVIFPDIVELKTAAPKDALPLWRKATVWYCVLLFPLAMILSIYAESAVVTLFTDSYSAASPVFSVFGISLILYCFDFHLPLRARNQNRYFVMATVLGLAVNLVLIYPLYSLFGIAGPAIAFVTSRLCLTVFLAVKTYSSYQLTFRELAHWKSIAMVAAAAVLPLPVLLAGFELSGQLLVRAIVFGSLYMLAYLMILRAFGVWDAFRLPFRSMKANS